MVGRLSREAGRLPGPLHMPEHPQPPGPAETGKWISLVQPFRQSYLTHSLKQVNPQDKRWTNVLKCLALTIQVTTTHKADTLNHGS